MKGKWRVHGVKYPMNYDGTMYSGDPKHKDYNSWFWVHRGGMASLFIRVQGRERAADIARQLNRAEAL